MNKKLAILAALALVAGLLALNGGGRQATAASVPVTLYYGDVTIDGAFRWMLGSWDLNAGPVTVSYELDLTNAPNNACNSWGGCPLISHWSAGNVGLVWPGSPWAGAWMGGFLSDWDNSSTMFPTFPDIDGTYDLDDKFNMARSPNPGSYDERHYDTDCVTGAVAASEVGTPNAWTNYGIWFDRDGVDQWQAGNWGSVDGGTYNSSGTYDVEITYDVASNYPTSKGTACAKVNGIQTGFYTAGWQNAQPGLYPYGISFDTDATKMADMRVFVSGAVYTGGQIIVRDLTVTGYLQLAEGMATGGGWFIAENTGGAGNVTPGGKAIFGFVAKQKSGTSSGQLEFQYQTDSLNLKSTSYDWVTVGTTQAMFEGIGVLNGVDGYKFRVRAVDGDKIGTGVDRFEIRIWTGTATWDAPTHRAAGDVGGGQVVVHKK